MKKTTAQALALALLAALALTGCRSSAAPASYAPGAPMAFGENGRCYYVDSPDEVYALRQAGRCPAAWAPMAMPLTWRETYASYYDSPAYYNTYVPVRYRTVYVTRVRTFETKYRVQITQRRTYARWSKPAPRYTPPAARYTPRPGNTRPGVITRIKTRVSSSYRGH